MPDIKLEATYGEDLLEDAVIEKDEDIKDDVVDEGEVQEEDVLENKDEDLDKEHEEEPTDEEVQALATGWRPEGVEGKRQLSAEEFNERSSFFDRIHKLEKQNDSLRGTVDEMAIQHGKIADLERTKVLDDLKSRKKTALAEEDYDQVIELDDRIAETREIPAQESQAKDEPYTDPSFAGWQEANVWYNASSNPEMYTEANALGEAFAKRTGRAGTEMYAYVETTMKRMYPEKFGMVHKRGNPQVEGGRTPAPRKRAGPKKYSKKDLNENQRRVMNTYVKRGVMTEDEYITELAKIGELG